MGTFLRGKVVTTCTVCIEDYEQEKLHACPNSDCNYILCIDCIRRSFEDITGESYQRCPMCKTPLARDLIQSVLGKGAVDAVENELRRKVEYDVEAKARDREARKTDMKSYKEKARSMYNDLSEILNLKCPRCQQVFYDYSGCNALRCSNEDCTAAFCAICLEDCGENAHPHVRQMHGNLFDKAAFETARKDREEATLSSFLFKIQDEPYEVRQLVKNFYMDSSDVQATNATDSKVRASKFIADAKSQLLAAIRSDRLGVLKDPTDRGFQNNGISSDHISPRYVIPRDFKLQLREIQDGIFVVELFHSNGVNFMGEIRWEKQDLNLFDESGDTAAATERRQVDALINVVTSLKCGVLAFSRSRCLYQSSAVRLSDRRDLGPHEVAICLHPVTNTGDVDFNIEAPVPGTPVVGIAQNARYRLLEKHICGSDESTLLFDALRDYIGCNAPKNVFTDIEVPAPVTFEDLNDQQRQVAHPLCLKTATEVAGPPGTGKTKTITELIRCLLECTHANVLVLSERNGAIDAIAEKFVERCLEKKPDGIHHIKDIAMWDNLVVYGSSGGLGPAARLFTLETKLKYHPELVDLRRTLEKKRNEQRTAGKEMQKTTGEALLKLSVPVSQENLHSRARAIMSGTEAGFDWPVNIIVSLKSFFDAAGKVLQNQMDFHDFLAEYNTILLGLVRLPETKNDEKRNMQIVTALRDRIAQLIRAELFDLAKSEEMQAKLRCMEGDLSSAEERVIIHMCQTARVRMSTIGSSHKLPTLATDGGVEEQLEAMSLMDTKSIVIFDESGCIPAYELLGLSRLGQSFDALVAVGDSKQLPPFSPHQNFQSSRQKVRQSEKEKPVKSILDVSKRLTQIKLSTQYRVPRDIAEILNARIYKGDYKTPETCNVPHKGFVFVDVPNDREGREKYVNSNEIMLCLQLVRELQRDGEFCILFLTPYKKQQREMQFQLKREGVTDVTVLTIDQCQGQEADYVLLSLVQRPTKFLDKHRFNVALSRVRKRLFLLADRDEFRAASRNDSWECSLMAKDLLRLSENEQ